MRIALTGSSGLIGAALTARLEASGHRVRRMLRTERAEEVGDPGGDAAWWNPDKGYLDAKALEGVDAVVNLAGRPVAGRRWSAAEKARIRDSRITGTRLLAARMAEMARPPSVFVSASAVGWYGSRGDLPLEEGEAPGTDFLAAVCRDWEAAAAPAAKAGVRVVHPRFGAVLDPGGGMLARRASPARRGRPPALRGNGHDPAAGQPALPARKTHPRGPRVHASGNHRRPAGPPGRLIQPCCHI